MQIQLQHRAVHDGETATLDVIDVTGGRYVPPTTPGLQGEITPMEILVVFRSYSHRVFHKVFKAQDPSRVLRLTLHGHTRAWFLQNCPLSPTASDNLVRMTLHNADGKPYPVK